MANGLGFVQQAADQIVFLRDAPLVIFVKAFDDLPSAGQVFDFDRVVSVQTYPVFNGSNPVAVALFRKVRREVHCVAVFHIHVVGQASKGQAHPEVGRASSCVTPHYVEISGASVFPLVVCLLANPHVFAAARFEFSGAL